MKKKHYIVYVLTVLSMTLIGCKAEYPGGEYEDWNGQTGAPRLLVNGTVTNTADEPLQGIYVAIFGVREPNEPDLLSYNYAITDTAGRYTIVRYRGRELPTEVTVVATDSAGVYEEQYLFATVRYDTIDTSSGKQAYNAFVTADFVLAVQD